MKKNTETFNHTRAWKRMLALLCAVAAMLTMFALPASAKSSGGFQYFVDGPYTDDDDPGVVITGYKSAVNGTLTIPAKLAGYKVWSVSEGAFADRKDIKKVVVSEGVYTIGAHAFENCTNLRTLVVGDVYICSYAFDGCTALKKVKITAYKGDLNPEWGWDEPGNDALFGAKWQWTHYTKDDFDVETEVCTRTGRTVTLTTEYGKLKKGESFHWYGYDIYPTGDTEWKDCTGDSVVCKSYWDGEQYAVCEVHNSKGDVVWSQKINVQCSRSLTDRLDSAISDTYVYGVTQYTLSHFRWRVMNMLEKMGVDVYGA